MLFHVRMDVHLPADLDPHTRSELIGREKAYSQDLQRKGKWPHIWRIAGEYAELLDYRRRFQRRNCTR